MGEARVVQLHVQMLLGALPLLLSIAFSLGHLNSNLWSSPLQYRLRYVLPMVSFLPVFCHSLVSLLP